MEFWLSVMGVVLVLEGIPWFLAPAGVKRALRQIQTLPDGPLRLLGLGFMLAGLLFVYLAVGRRG